MNYQNILINHTAGFTRLTERKFTTRTKVHGKKINNENLSLTAYGDVDIHIDNREIFHQENNNRGAGTVECDSDKG